MANSKPKFFFEADPAAKSPGLSWQEHAETFFSTLQDTGVVKESNLDLSEKTAAIDGEMKTSSSKLVQIEYGTYQNNYAVHITPIHPARNLRSEDSVKQAVYVLAKTLNEHVPYSSTVNLFLPRPDWKVKVISAVILEGAKTWNLDIKKLEREAIPKIMQEVEKVILAC
jgi:hypothetical protein